MNVLNRDRWQHRSSCAEARLELAVDHRRSNFRPAHARHPLAANREMLIKSPKVTLGWICTRDESLCRATFAAARSYM